MVVKKDKKSKPSGAKKEQKNGKAKASSSGDQPKLDAAALEQISAIRSKIHETFGKVALAMMVLPRYRHQSLSDLNQLLLEPLIRDRVAIASSKPKGGDVTDTKDGVAIWASVSEAVDAKIREQIKAGVFPVRLQADDWNSGKINWLFDVIAPNQALTTAVIANFRQVIKEGEMRIHPLVTRLIDPEALKKMGAKQISPDGTPKKKSN